jgi:hypothetical protein
MATLLRNEAHQAVPSHGDEQYYGCTWRLTTIWNKISSVSSLQQGPNWTLKKNEQCIKKRWMGNLLLMKPELPRGKWSTPSKAHMVLWILRPTFLSYSWRFTRSCSLILPPESCRNVARKSKGNHSCFYKLVRRPIRSVEGVSVFFIEDYDGWVKAVNQPQELIMCTNYGQLSNFTPGGVGIWSGSTCSGNLVDRFPTGEQLCIL